MTSLRHNSNFQINVQWNPSSGPVLQNPAFFDIGYSADISLPESCWRDHWELFHKCGFSEQILWFRVAVALQLQPITR